MQPRCSLTGNQTDGDMTLHHRVAFLFIIQLLFADIQCSGKENVVAQFGETVHLNCTTTQEVYIDWHHNSDVIYVNGIIDDSLRSKYSIDTSTDGEYTLVIHNVTVAEGGEYKCIDNAGQGPELVTYILAVKECACVTPATAAAAENPPAECDPVYWPWIIMAFSIVTVFACAILIIICWCKGYVKLPQHAAVRNGETADLEQTVEDLRQQNREHEQIIQDLRQQNREHEQIIQDIRQQNTVQVEATNQAQQEKQHLECVIRSLEETNGRQDQTIRNLEETVRVKEQEKLYLENRVQVLETDKVKQDAEVEYVKMNRDELQKEGDRLKDELRNKDVEFTRVETDLKHISEQKEEYKKESWELKEKCEEYRSKLEKSEKELAEAEIHLKYLREDYNSFSEKPGRSKGRDRTPSRDSTPSREAQKVTDGDEDIVESAPCTSTAIQGQASPQDESERADSSGTAQHLAEFCNAPTTAKQADLL